MSLANVQSFESHAIPGGNWLRPLHAWPRAIIEQLRRDPAVVRVLIASLRGSAPREAGACMLVCADGIRGSIGGGHLEWQAIQAARGSLQGPAASAQLQRLILGAELGQCCGGVVELWTERYTREDLNFLAAIAQASDGERPAELVGVLQNGRVERRIARNPSAFASAATPYLIRRHDAVTLHERLDGAHPPLWLYGAGHVGQALVRIAAELPLRVTLIDPRAELLPATLPDPVRALHSVQPVGTVQNAKAGTRFLVMTHSHALDYALCRSILQRGDFAWLGLIGSASKAARFRSRLAREGMDAARIARLVCPIGVEGIDSKWPTAIAVGVAAQLLQVSESTPATGCGAIANTVPNTDSGDSSEGCIACQTNHRKLVGLIDPPKRLQD